MDTKSITCCFFFLSISLTTTLSLSSDTISQSQYLSGNQTLISKGGNFELGFFKPGNSSNYYIGIWYKKLQPQTIVWVANRDSPITDPSTSKLTVTETGNLVLLNKTTQVWSSNSTSSASNTTSAVLLETSNLVIITNLSGPYLWQSFAHPTDTWMPGGWLGVNKITGEYQSLTSWKNSDDPGTGIFSHSVDPDGSNQYVSLWNGTNIYWSSGLWNGQYFSNVPETKQGTVFNYTFVNNNERKYATYTILDSSVTTRFVFDSSGQGKQWYLLGNSGHWLIVDTEPLDQCSVYSLCGVFGVCHDNNSTICQCPHGFRPSKVQEWDLNDWNSGCSRKTQLGCGDKDGFLEMSNMRLPANSETLTVQDCEQECKKNCSCTAYSYNTSVCSIWKGELRNLEQSHSSSSGFDTLFLRLAASDIPISRTSHKSHKVLGVILGGGVAVILIGFVIAWAYRRRRQTRISKQVDGSLIRFSYSDLQRMTKNFSDRLGGGGFGSVYRGTMSDSRAVAVKKLEGLGQGEKQFRTEVSMLGAIQHVNLVRLYGFCFEGSQRLLVYEYMSGGSLDARLIRDSSTYLDWKTRFHIILGTARGLVYLHERCRERIIHCDIKPENILLDEEFCPKVSDFGLAKLVGRDFSRVLTTMRGTIGYLAPEWISGVAVTPKVDVYSFGMMLFELVSGSRNLQLSERSEPFYPTYAARKVIEGDVMSLLDPRLGGDTEVEEVRTVCKVAIWCIQDLEDHRPTMGQVIQILEGGLEVKMPPIPSVLQNMSQQDQPVFQLQYEGDPVPVPASQVSTE